MGAKLEWHGETHQTLQMGPFTVARIVAGYGRHTPVIEAYGRWPVEDQSFLTPEEARDAVEPEVRRLLRGAGVDVED